MNAAATINVPIWYAGLAAVALPAIGWLAATLRLTAKRDAVKSDLRELERLTDWSVPEEPREPGHQPWPEPLSPREHERAATAVMDAAPERDLEPTEAIVGAHAAPPAEPNWYRGENRPLTWGWWVEMAARVASIGYKPRLVEHVPAHAAWTADDDEALEVEVQRHRSGFEHGVAQLLDDVVHMGVHEAVASVARHTGTGGAR